MIECVLRCILEAYATEHRKWFRSSACHARRNARVTVQNDTFVADALHPDAVWRRKTERVVRGSSRCDMNKRSTALLSRAIFLVCRYRPITFRYRPSNCPTKVVINPLRAFSIVFISFDDSTLNEYTNRSEIFAVSFNWSVVFKKWSRSWLLVLNKDLECYIIYS